MMTPSVSQLSCLRHSSCSGLLIPSLSCSSSIKRSWETDLWNMAGPSLRLGERSRHMGCTLEVSFVCLITDFILMEGGGGKDSLNTQGLQL